MDNIKFRVVDSSGSVVAFEYFDPAEGWFHVLCYNNSTCPGPFNDKEWKYIPPCKREAFIGKQDKNGNDIYEGDIVRFWTNSSRNTTSGILEIVTVDNFLLCPFYDGTYTEDEQGDWFEYDKGFEIVGDIHREKIDVKYKQGGSIYTLITLGQSEKK